MPLKLVFVNCAFVVGWCRFNVDARFTGAYSAYRHLLWTRLPVMLFTSTYSATQGVIIFAAVAIFMLYMNGFANSKDPFQDALAALAMLGGLSAMVSNLAKAFAVAGPTFGIFQRIANGLQKLKDVRNTYEYFDGRYVNFTNGCQLFSQSWRAPEISLEFHGAAVLFNITTSWPSGSCRVARRAGRCCFKT